MAENGDLQQEILQKTLQEVAHEEAEGDPCVICLETITEPSIAKPCNHANFDYLCLVSWLEQQPSCPLCKTLLTEVQYDLQAPSGRKTYQIPLEQTEKPARGSDPRHGAFPGRPRERGRRPHLHTREHQPPQEDPLSVRRNVYRNQLYSLRVGTNRLSQYSEVTPQQFNRDETLASRARKWIRWGATKMEAEQPRDRDRVPRPGHQRLEDRRANNAEFLLEYIIAILRTVDIKGSAGQAEELLRDFIGRDNARLFLHELLAWLRSPYTSLENWDRHVQYPETHRRLRNYNEDGRGCRSSPSRARSASPARQEPDRSLFDRVSRPGRGQSGSRRSRGGRSNRHSGMPRNLLDRYIPD
ncbi:hypothetical protein N7468_009564 [Penicillium chermesinum]|uniref:RING-type E3 ubiquitin transferase n=1 Tax=Penicillium chermesinum TaxID=63820 RepID=A0A9W9NI22_9EURO|nr:uncharacterized protein N7468_009564 [Penicillium chermesinum]KAJ5220360.1 hypothetical protein N7468_009564 [Penicillium chermesinum]